MSQEIEVNNCFDAAFYQIYREHPEADKSMSDDYNLPPWETGEILHVTASILSSRGYLFGLTEKLVNKCSKEKVKDVLVDINAATKPKRELPLLKELTKKEKKSASKKKRT